MSGNDPNATPPEPEEQSRTSYWEWGFDLFYSLCEAVVYGVLWLVGSAVRAVFWLLAGLIGES